MYLYLRTELDRTYLQKNVKKKTFFNKDFYEMLPKIEVYQSETASQRSPSCCTPGCLFTQRSLLILTSSCHVCLHSHKKLWLY